jgi:hypothetical protein
MTEQEGTAPAVDVEKGDEHSDAINDNRQTVINEINDLLAKKTELQEKIQELNQKCTELSTVVESAETLKTNAATSLESVQRDIDAIAKAKTNFDSLGNDAHTQASEMVKEQDSLKKILSSVSLDREAVLIYKQDLLDDKKDENGNAIPSIKTKIGDAYSQAEKKFTEINQYHTDLTTSFARLEQDFIDKINALLPGAGAVGLASAYFEAKGRYGMLPFKSESKKQGERLLQYCWYGLVGCVRHSINHILFIAPIIGIVAMFASMLDFHNGVQSALQSVSNIPPSVILFRAFLSLPFGLLSWFGFSSIQLSRRLYEEYNYKQRVMQTYHSFEREIAETKNEELKEHLLKIMLDVVEYKPALIMPEHQGFPDINAPLDSLNNVLKSLAEILTEMKKISPTSST